MKLYHLTAIPPTGITAIAQGSFTAPRQQQLIVSTGTSLELYQLSAKQGRLLPIFRSEVFANIRSIAPFRLPATRRDYVVIASDSGSVSILSPDVPSATFRQVHCETFGRSGCRRTVPGQFLACDPRGRACMLSAIERAKFAYVLNRDPQDNLTISSPLQAHKSSCATFALRALDVGFENPVFAALERTYDHAAVKQLVYYELDLGLNHVVRKLSAPVRPSSYVILPVPGHTDGPGGLLVCSDGFITYRNLLTEPAVPPPDATAPKDTQEPPAVFLETALPFREGTDPAACMIVSAATYLDRKRTAFFFMLCTEFGDLLKVELTWSLHEGVSAIRLVYFDSLPSPAICMTIFRAGYLFAVLEGGDSLLLKFKTVDVPDDVVSAGISVARVSDTSGLHQPAANDVSMHVDSSAAHSHLGNAHDLTNGALHSLSAPPSDASSLRKLAFVRKDRLSFFTLASTLESLAPILGLCNATDADGEAALLLSTGRGRTASVRGLRRAIGVIDLLDPHPLPSRVFNVFTFKQRVDSVYHGYIVVSFRDRTKVLSVGDANVIETFTSGFHSSSTTLCAGLMATDSFVQVHAQGVRYIPGGRADEASEWSPPVPARILAGCCNNGQVIVALSNGNVMCFEVDSQNNALIQLDRIDNAIVPSGGNESVSLGAGDDGAMPAVAIPDVPPGRRRAAFFAVGDGANCKVRIYRLGHDGIADPLGIHVAPAAIESLAFVDYGIKWKPDASGEPGLLGDSLPYVPFLSLVIGTKRGAVVRISVDGVTGSLGDKRSMFLGPDKVRVRCATMGGVPTAFALGLRPFVMFAQGGRVVMSPLATEGVQHAAALSTAESPDGFVAASGAKIRLLFMNSLHAMQSGVEIPTDCPASALPFPTAMGNLFHLTRSRFSATLRKVVRVAERSGSGDGSRRDSSGAKRPRSQNLFVVVESDHRAVLPTAAAASDVRKDGNVELVPGGPGKWFSRLQLVRMGGSDGADGTVENDDVEYDGSDAMFNFNSEAVNCLDRVDMKDSSECVVSAVSTCWFPPGEGETDTISFVVMGCANHLVASATSAQSRLERQAMQQDGSKMSGSLIVFRIDREFKLRRVHETKISEPAYALCAFRDMIVAGVGTSVVLYALGKRQLLRKVEYRLAVANRVCALATSGGDRIFVADKEDSVTLFKFVGSGAWGAAGSGGLGEASDCGRLIAIASDDLGRWVTCLHAIDYSTVCGGDLFGNLFVLRLPSEVSAGAEEIGGTRAGGGSLRNGGVTGAQCANHRLRVEACMHVGSAVSCISVAKLDGGISGSGSAAGGHGNGRSSNGGTEFGADGSQEMGSEGCIVYGSIDGRVGVVMPFATTSDADFGQRLEMGMRKDWRSLVGRDHLSFRSSFYGGRGIVDGDLCELFVSADKDKKTEWANAVGRSVQDVIRKLDELRMAAI